MNKLSYNVNNGRTLEIVQEEHDGEVTIIHRDANGQDEANRRDKLDYIPAGDMVMLVNFYNYVKRYDIQNDFINPKGKNKE